MQTKLRRLIRNEVLLNNRVDNEFNKIMLPLNVLQQITFAQKYRIRYKFITPNNNITNLVAFCVLIFILSSSWYQYLTMELNSKLSFSKLLQMASYILTQIFEPIVLLTNFAYIVRYSNTNVTLFLKLQRIAKFTKYSKHKDFAIFNWVGLVIFVGFHVSVLIIIFIHHHFILWSQIILLLINLNIFYTSRFVNLLRKSLVLWKDIIIELEHTIGNKNEEETQIIIHQTGSFAELFNCVRDILEAFSILKRTFELMVRFI